MAANVTLGKGVNQEILELTREANPSFYKHENSLNLRLFSLSVAILPRQAYGCIFVKELTKENLPLQFFCLDGRRKEPSKAEMTADRQPGGVELAFLHITGAPLGLSSTPATSPSLPDAQLKK